MPSCCQPLCPGQRCPSAGCSLSCPAPALPDATALLSCPPRSTLPSSSSAGHQAAPQPQGQLEGGHGPALPPVGCCDRRDPGLSRGPWEQCGGCGSWDVRQQRGGTACLPPLEGCSWLCSAAELTPGPSASSGCSQGASAHFAFSSELFCLSLPSPEDDFSFAPSLYWQAVAHSLLLPGSSRSCLLLCPHPAALCSSAGPGLPGCSTGSISPVPRALLASMPLAGGMLA